MKCPICKRKLFPSNFIITSDGYELSQTEYCKEGHYEFTDSNDSNGFYIRIGDKSMDDLYSYSAKICRNQNVVISRWINKERKKYRLKR